MVDVPLSVAVAGTSAPISPRPRGRPRGLPKSGGRQAGQRNLLSHDIKEAILQRGRPWQLLADVSRGVKIRIGPQAGPGTPEYVYPSLQDRMSAARTLLAKLVPDVKAIEMTGADGGPIAVADTAEAIEARAAAWERLGAALRAGGLAGQGEPAGSHERREGHRPTRVLTPSYGEQTYRPSSGIEHAPPGGPAVPPGYVLEPTANGLAVMYLGKRVFHAASEPDAICFVSQHRPVPP